MFINTITLETSETKTPACVQPLEEFMKTANRSIWAGAKYAMGRRASPDHPDYRDMSKAQVDEATAAAARFVENANKLGL